jgi:hypothetical protein
LGSSTTLTLRLRLKLVRMAFRLVNKAMLIHEFRRTDLLTLPSIEGPITLSEATVKQMAHWIFLVVNILVFWRWGKCFYRAFVTASILRQWNVPLVLNMGVSDPFALKWVRAHCWLSLNDELVQEPITTKMKYPILLGQVEGQINYWASRDDSHPKQEPIQKA